MLSSYIKLINTQLHSAMRLISGCLYPTQFSWLNWLPVLSNVATPSPRHKAAADNMLQINKAPPNWPVYMMSLSIHLHDLHLGTQYSQT